MLLALLLACMWLHVGWQRKPPQVLVMLRLPAVSQRLVAAMTLLGAFNDLFALQIFLATMVSSVAVLVLGVGLSRRISKAGAAG